MLHSSRAKHNPTKSTYMMKLSSPLVLSLYLMGFASAGRLQVPSSRKNAARSRPHDAHSRDAARVLKEETAATGVGPCGQCNKADDCLPNYECVGAAESGCFNFDVSAITELYCTPVPNSDSTVMAVTTAGPTADTASTSSPTMAATDSASTTIGEPTVSTGIGTTSPPTVIVPVEETAAPTAAATESATTTEPTTSVHTVAATATEPTAAPTIMAAPTMAATTIEPTTTPTTVTATAVEPTATPTIAATTIGPTTTPTVAATAVEPTATPTIAATDTATTLNPTPPPAYATIRWVGGNPEISLRACEGDCDDDDDCEGSLVCMQRSGDEPIPGCGGDVSPRSEADYCVRPSDPELIDVEFDLPGGSVIAAVQTAPSSPASAVGTAATAAALGIAATVVLIVLGMI